MKVTELISDSQTQSQECLTLRPAALALDHLPLCFHTCSLTGRDVICKWFILGRGPGMPFLANAGLVSKLQPPQPFLTQDRGQAIASWGLNLGSVFCAWMCGHQSQVMSIRQSQGHWGGRPSRKIHVQMNRERWRTELAGPRSQGGSTRWQPGSLVCVLALVCGAACGSIWPSR